MGPMGSRAAIRKLRNPAFMQRLDLSPAVNNGAPSRAYSTLLMKAWEYYEKTTTRVVNGEGAFSLLKGYEYEHYSQS